MPSNIDANPERKGFAALSSLVSDIGGESAEPVNEESGRTSWVGSAGRGPGVGAPADTLVQPSASRGTQQIPAKKPKRLSASAKWWITGIVVTAVWIGFALADANSTPQAVSDKTYDSDTSAPATPNDTAVNFSGSSQSAVPEEEEKPPVGVDLVFNSAQIRYCLSEDIRLTAAKQVVDHYVPSEIDQFNLMVDDYNIRCSSFRYLPSTLDRVRASVESNRSNLEGQGKARF